MPIAMESPASATRTGRPATATLLSTFVPIKLQPVGPGFFSDPLDHLVQHFVQRRLRLETEDVSRLPDVGNAHLDVVLERRIADVAERATVGVDLAPDALGKLKYGRRGGGRQVEVVVDCVRRLHRKADPVRKVATVGVVPDLVADAQDV